MSAPYLHPGKRLGSQYELEELLGTGQFGQVWRARKLNPPSDSPVAVKVPLDPRRGEEVLMADAQYMLDVPRHPGVVSIAWQGRVGPLWVIEMEYVNGLPLDVVMNDTVRWSKVTFEDMVQWFVGVADALGHLHANRVTHGDIKPDNLLLDEVSWQLKLTDFGTSRRLTDNLIKTTRHGGAWAYQAPEIQQANERGAVSDLFSVGAVLYHMVTGRLPRATIQELLTSAPIVRPRQYNAAVPEDLESIIMELLEDDPRRRLPDAMTLKVQLEELVSISKEALPAPETLPAGTGYLDHAKMLLSEGKREEARRAASQASLHSTGLVPALELFARLSDDLGYTDDAISAYEKLLALDQIGLETRRAIEMSLSDMLLRLKRYEDARKYVEAAVRENGVPRSVRLKGAIAVGACGNLDRSLELLDGLLQESSKDGAAMEKKAWVLWLQHKYDESAQVCRDVLEIMPESEVCLRRLAEYEQLVGNPRRAQHFRSRLEALAGAE